MTANLRRNSTKHTKFLGNNLRDKGLSDEAPNQSSREPEHRTLIKALLFKDNHP